LEHIHSYGSCIEEEFKSKIAFEITLNYPKLFNALVDSFSDIKRIEVFHPLKKGSNQVKLASHVAFWFLRWQPCSIEPQNDFLESIDLKKSEKKKLMLINEILMVPYLISSIFKNGEIECKKTPVKSMVEWKGYYEYLLYYLAYRLRSPKELEAMLGSATLHPLWKVHNDIYFGVKNETESNK